MLTEPVAEDVDTCSNPIEKPVDGEKQAQVFLRESHSRQHNEDSIEPRGYGSRADGCDRCGYAKNMYGYDPLNRLIVNLIVSRSRIVK